VDTIRKPTKLNADTEGELSQCVARMKSASNSFYYQATLTGNHAFIEFCGLMNEYIKVCEQSAESGIDFREANVHSGTTMPVHDFNLEYIAEKFACIFTPVLKTNPRAMEVFTSAINKKANH